MLSGIASLKCKLVKNVGQRLQALFTRAKISAKFHCMLFKICWSKPYTAFVKVVEGQLIYYFAIQHLAYFCFKNLRKRGQRRSVWSVLAPGAPKLVPRDIGAPRCARGHRGTLWARTSRHSCDLRFPRPSYPRPCANASSPRAAPPRAGHNLLEPAAACHWPTAPTLDAQLISTPPYPTPCRDLAVMLDLRTTSPSHPRV
jgi:hypothetical protein